MPTENPRINITIGKTDYALLTKIAKDKPLATLAKELLFEALEARADVYFSELADERDMSINANNLIEHQDVWK